MGISSAKTTTPSFIRDVVLTFGTSALMALASVLATPWLAQGMGPAGFGTFSLARRLVFWATTISSLDMAVALTRHLGLSRGDVRQSRDFLVAALAIVAGACSLTVFVGVMFARSLAGAAFDEPGSVLLVWASLFMMVAHGFYHLAYAYYRGIGEMWKSNLIQLAAVGFGGLAVAWFLAERGPVFVLVATGVTYVLAGLCLIPRLLRPVSGNGEGVRTAVATLVRYGAPRVFAGFSYQGLLATGPMLAAFVSLETVAYLTLAQITFMVLEVAFGAFGLVALPRVAQLTASGTLSAALRTGVADVLIFAAQVGIFTTLQGLVWADLLVEVWLGPKFAEVTPQLRIALLGLLPYTAFTLLKSVIDGAESRPVNARHLVYALIAAWVAGLALQASAAGPLGAAIAVTVAFWILGLLTVRFTLRRFGIELSPAPFGQTIFVNAVLAAGSMGGHYLMSGTSGIGPRVGIGMLTCSALSGAYLAWLWRSNVGWMRRGSEGLRRRAKPAT